jgi:hypothetical protein
VSSKVVRPESRRVRRPPPTVFSVVLSSVIRGGCHVADATSGADGAAMTPWVDIAKIRVGPIGDEQRRAIDAHLSRTYRTLAMRPPTRPAGRTLSPEHLARLREYNRRSHEAAIARRQEAASAALAHSFAQGCGTRPCLGPGGPAVRCRCGVEFGSSIGPGLIRSECVARSRMTRREAAVPADGKNSGRARPLKSSTSYRHDGGFARAARL